MYKLIAFALVAAVTCNDLIQGPEVGRKIFDEKKEASPAIWKQKNEVTIKANDTDVISRIVITDQRPDKDGEVKIVEGGQGQKNVTIELKSPTILRGYDFHIEVYAVEEGMNIPEVLYPEEVTEQMPAMENDTQVNLTKEVTIADDSMTEKTEANDKVEAPVTDRQSRNIDVTVAPTVQHTSEGITEASKTEIQGMPLKSDSLLLPTPQEDMMKHLQVSEDKNKMVHAIIPNHHDAPLYPHTLKEELHGLKTNVNRNQATSTDQSTTVEATEPVTEGF